MARRRVAISSFTVFLLILASTFWAYYLFTIIWSTSCNFATNWVSGWFGYGSPFQLFALSFLLAFAVWLMRLVAFWRDSNAIETLLQGALILGLALSLSFLNAMLFPFATPSIQQAKALADFVSPAPELLYEIEVAHSPKPPPWPYDFPTPPSYPHPREWFDGFVPEMDQIFTSANSPTFGEYVQMQQCASRLTTRSAEYEREVDAFETWHREYGWRVDPAYLRYKWD